MVTETDEREARRAAGTRMSLLHAAMLANTRNANDAVHASPRLFALTGSSCQEWRVYATERMQYEAAEAKSGLG